MKTRRTTLASRLLSPGRGEARDSRIQNHLGSFQGFNRRQNRLKKLIVRALLKAAGHRGVHQFNCIVYEGLRLCERHRASMGEGRKLREVVCAPPGSAFNKRKGVFDFTSWIADLARDLKNPAGVISSYLQCARAMDQGDCNNASDGKPVLSAENGVLTCDPDRNTNSGDRPYSLDPGGPIGFAQVIGDSQQNHIKQSTESQKGCQYGPVVQPSNDSCHLGILSC